LKFSNIKDKHEFRPLLVEIEERPLSPLGRTLLWVILAFLAIMAIWLYVAKIDVVVTARGKLIPYGEIKMLQPIETGVISDILVKEGEFVRKGDLLIAIDPSVNDTNIESKRKNLSHFEVEITRLEALIGKKEFKVPAFCHDSSIVATEQLIYSTTKLSFTQQTQLIEEQISQAKEQIEGSLSDQGRLIKILFSLQQREDRLIKVIDIIAKDDFDELHNQVIEYQEQIKIKEHTISELRAKLSELYEQRKLVAQEYQKRLLEELTQKRKEATTLKVEIDAIEFRRLKQNIISPVDGYVGKLLVHTVGGVVTPAEKLISIIPKDAPLVIKATVLNQDIGFIKKGMHSAIKIDTYSFQKYGLLSGNVTHISDDSIEDEKLGAVYEIYIKPSEKFLKSKNGEKHEIHSGMSVTSELKVGKRRVIEFFIYPLIKYMDEGMSVR